MGGNLRVKIQIDVPNNEVHVDEIDKTLPDKDAMKLVAFQLRKLAERLDPQVTRELIVNEDRLDDITEEMKLEFFTNHEGSIH